MNICTTDIIISRFLIKNNTRLKNDLNIYLDKPVNNIDSHFYYYFKH